MYGYAYSAARHGVWHTWVPGAMLYPGYVPEGVPLLLHYGLEIRVRIPDPSMDDKGLEALRAAAEADARGELDDDGGDGRDEIVSAARLAREVDPPSHAPAAASALVAGGPASSSLQPAPAPPPRFFVWSWDKHSFTRHNVSRCPPWTVVRKHPRHGLFAQPPLPDMLDPAEEPVERYTNLIAIETVHTANAALCEWFLTQCPTVKGDWLRRRCARVRRGYEAVKAELRRWDARFACADFYVSREAANCRSRLFCSTFALDRPSPPPCSHLASPPLPLPSPSRPVKQKTTKNDAAMNKNKKQQKHTARLPRVGAVWRVREEREIHALQLPAQLQGVRARARGPAAGRVHARRARGRAIGRGRRGAAAAAAARARARGGGGRRRRRRR